MWLVVAGGYRRIYFPGIRGSRSEVRGARFVVSPLAVKWERPGWWPGLLFLLTLVKLYALGNNSTVLGGWAWMWFGLSWLDGFSTGVGV